MSKVYIYLTVLSVLSISSFFIFSSKDIKYWVQGFTSLNSNQLVPQINTKQLASLQTIPKFNKDKPLSNGVILLFRHWPLTKQQQKIILQKTKIENLKPKEPLFRLKAWGFFWDKWYTHRV